MLKSPESLNSSQKFDLHQSVISAAAVSIDENGRIRLPGFPAGLSVQSYFPLVHLYAKVQEVSRILDRYRDALRLPGADIFAHSNDNAPNANLDTKPELQAPLTALTPSQKLPHFYYKREDQTVTRAYKVRGAVVGMAKVLESGEAERFLAVSTGNHALGVLKAAALLSPQSVRLVVPGSTANLKLQKLQKAIDGLNANGIQAELLFKGETFDEARAWALGHVADGEAYLDPYNDPWVVAGQGTLGLELLRQIGDILKKNPAYEEVVIISPVGGGGLLTGTATALKLGALWEPVFRNVSIRLAGQRLDDFNSPLGDAIRVAHMADSNRILLDNLQVPLRDMSNEHMAEGMAFVLADLGVKVEGASGGAVYPALAEADYQPNEKRLVISVLSGGNTI
jgi:threonine dehydratase